MPLKLLAHTHIALLGPQTVDGADIVQTTTRHKAARRSIRTGHYPAGAKRNGVDLWRRGGEEVVRGREGEREGKKSVESDLNKWVE